MIQVQYELEARNSNFVQIWHGVFFFIQVRKSLRLFFSRLAETIEERGITSPKVCSAKRHDQFMSFQHCFPKPTDNGMRIA